MTRMLSYAVAAIVLAGEVTAQGTALTQLNRRDKVLGWEAVGRVDIKNGGFCTGTLIAPDLVLTAAHCVYDPHSNAKIQPEQIAFRAGLSNGNAIAERRVVQIAAHRKYHPGEEMGHENVRHDVALMRLETPISTTDADPFAVHSGKSAGGQVSVVSYGRGRSEALSRQRSCAVLVQVEGVMVFDCNVTFGSSGAPVFARVGGRGQIVSVISGMGRYQKKSAAFGMTLPKIVAELKHDLRVQAVAPVAGIKRIQVGRISTSGTRVGGAKFVKP